MGTTGPLLDYPIQPREGAAATNFDPDGRSYANLDRRCVDRRPRDVARRRAYGHHHARSVSGGQDGRINQIENVIPGRVQTAWRFHGFHEISRGSHALRPKPRRDRSVQRLASMDRQLPHRASRDSCVESRPAYPHRRHLRLADTNICLRGKRATGMAGNQRHMALVAEKNAKSGRFGEHD